MFTHSLLDFIRSRLTDRRIEFARYLVVGGWNTAFGMISYAVLYRLLGGKAHYLLLLVPSNILAVTNAFFCYRIFVFRSRGNILREYFRCYIVYGSMMLVSAGLMWLLVGKFKLPPPLANCASIAATTIVSFFAHRNFSFRSPSEPSELGSHRA